MPDRSGTGFEISDHKNFGGRRECWATTSLLRGRVTRLIEAPTTLAGSEVEWLTGEGQIQMEMTIRERLKAN